MTRYADLTELEEHAFRAEYVRLRAGGASSSGPLRCAVCDHEWISFPGSQCPRRFRHRADQEAWANAVGSSAPGAAFGKMAAMIAEGQTTHHRPDCPTIANGSPLSHCPGDEGGCGTMGAPGRDGQTKATIAAARAMDFADRPETSAKSPAEPAGGPCESRQAESTTPGAVLLTGDEATHYRALCAAALAAQKAQSAMATTGAELRDAIAQLCKAIAPGDKP